MRSRAGIGLLVGLVFPTGCGGSKQPVSKQEYEAAVYDLAHGAIVLDVFTPVREAYHARWHAEAV